jgi:hypothetical protein
MENLGSYVVRPPVVVKFEHRICLEAITFAMRSAASALQAVRQITSAHNEDAEDFSESQRIGLYSHLWTVVDQLHFLRNLLHFMKAAGPIGDFCARYATATTMRNVMDHLKNNIPNLANLKQKRPTVFGSLAYFKYVGIRKDKDGNDVHFGRSVVLPFGHLIHGAYNFPGVNPAGKLMSRVSTDLFTFSAFGSSLDLYKLYDDLPVLARYLEDQTRASILASAKEISSREGIDIADLLKQPGETIILFDVEFALQP